MSRTASLRFLLCASLLATAASVPASASLSDVIPNLLGTRVILAPPGPGFPSHEAHFLDTSLALAATGRSLNESLVTQLSTFPIASSAGGFTYSFDPALGTFTRSSDSFGPIFMERAQTIGKGKWNLGLNYLSTHYDSLDNLDLRGGEIEFQLHHLDTPPIGDPEDPFFEGDIINVNTYLKVDTQTTVFFANYGATSRLDFSIVVPMVKVDLDATARLHIDRLSTAGIPGIHHFAGADPDNETVHARDTASGLGDVLLRGKLKLTHSDRGGLAAALDVRLPTGDEKDLLGTGFTQAKLSFIASGSYGRFAPHANLGYSSSWGSSSVISELPDEIDYSAGFDVAAHPRLTLVAELVGRTLRNATRATLEQQTFDFELPDGSMSSVQRPVVTFGRSDLNLLLGSVGLKYNPVGNLLVTADALYSLSNDGLKQDSVIGVFGLEYSF